MQKHLLGLSLSKLLVYSVVLLAICILTYTDSRLDMKPAKITNGKGITLQVPPFLQSVYAQGNSTAFDDAGIVAYVDIAKPIDLDHLEESLELQSVIKDPDGVSILWDMTPAGYDGLEAFDEYNNVKMFVHEDGWIFAFLRNGANASLLIDWIGYSENNHYSTILENLINQVVSITDTKNSDLTISYYHFAYPEATDLMLIVDKETKDETTDSFDIKVPSSFELYEASWSHVGDDAGESICHFNDEKLNTHEWCDRCWKFKQELLDDPSKLQTDEFQQFSIYHQGGAVAASFSACGLTLIYNRGR